ncbi:helix-turn-helix domain-containing protein [Pedobacter caeni]|uniref:Helix-turn-helix domain-containing protein n=1 Tax=Pedobacter caeni TaxID=288992 RepID=A0A1M4VA37_9SPHI|nr:AraC family transcriptional regulator [Pedobacter caeni]SHE65737.1 Helix-turn-helix domain-containing protein [Pedobacter caeni]
MFTNIIPVTDKLKRYITSFTVSQKGGVFPLRYTAFPNLGICLAFFNHTLIRIQPHEVTFTKDDTQGPEIILLGRLTRPTLITFNDPVDEISINFTPCGINFFFGIPFLEMAGKSHQLLNESTWTEFASLLFSKPPEKRIEKLEAFLLSSLNEHKGDTLERIFNSTAGIDKLTVQALSAIACMSERTFLRYFKKYFGCSPSTYKKILRFRNVLDARYSKNTNSYHRFLLTEDYYDSSHFRKEFVQFTDCSLRQFKRASFLPGNGSSVFKLM